MTVVVDIIGDKRTVLDYLLTPINEATSVASQKLAPILFLTSWKQRYL